MGSSSAACVTCELHKRYLLLHLLHAHYSEQNLQSTYSCGANNLDSAHSWTGIRVVTLIEACATFSLSICGKATSRIRIRTWALEIKGQIRTGNEVELRFWNSSPPGLEVALFLLMHIKERMQEVAMWACKALCLQGKIVPFCSYIQLMQPGTIPFN